MYTSDCLYSSRILLSEVLLINNSFVFCIFKWIYISMIPILWVKSGGSEPWYEDKCFTLRLNQLKLHKRVEGPQGESYLKNIWWIFLRLKLYINLLTFPLFSSLLNNLREKTKKKQNRFSIFFCQYFIIALKSYKKCDFF